MPPASEIIALKRAPFSVIFSLMSGLRVHSVKIVSISEERRESKIDSQLGFFLPADIAVFKPEFGRFRQTKSSQLFDYQRVQSFFKLLSCVHARACL